jgi:hypothetical protein
MKSTKFVASAKHWMLDDMASCINSTFVQLKIKKLKEKKKAA